MKSNKKQLRILIAGGGTGGHLFPGLAIAEELKEHRNCDIRFVGTKRGLEFSVLPKTDFPLYTIPVSGLYRVGFKKKIKTLLSLPFAFLKSFHILVSFRPHLIMGIGGYASGPVLALAVLLLKKTIIQEQNAFPGMTNRLLGKYVKLAFIPFKSSAHLFKNPVVVGNPIRKAIKTSALLQRPAMTEKETITISIVGGSQGAHILNKTMTESLPMLKRLAKRIKIVHQTGKNDYDWVKKEYEKFPELESRIEAFITDMADLYQNSDLMLCRSGSMINEIIAMGIASVLVPITASSGDHQRENAKTMVGAEAAIMIEEKDLSSASFNLVIEELITSPDKLQQMGRNAKKLHPGDSAAKIASTILERFNF